MTKDKVISFCRRLFWLFVIGGAATQFYLLLHASEPRDDTDGVMVGLLNAQAVAFSYMALLLPLGWIGFSKKRRIHTVLYLLLGMVIVSWPIIFVVTMEAIEYRHTPTRMHILQLLDW